MGGRIVAAPMAGRCIPLSEVPDPLFACGAMGPGVAIVPSDGWLCSPVTGTVLKVADTRHAILLRSDDGVEVLVHCGIDTVTLEGAPFSAHVGTGDRVAAGQHLMDVDLAAIRGAGLDPVTPVIVVNQPLPCPVEPRAEGAVAAGEAVISVG